MKLNKKRSSLALFSLAATGVAAPLFIAVSCGKSTGGSSNPGSSWELSSHRNIQLAHSSIGGTNPYASRSWQYAPKTATVSNSIFGESLNSYYAGPFRLDLEGFVKYDSQGNVISNVKQAKEILRFELAKAVEVVTTSGTEVFDSDSADLTNAKSINGTAFKTLLESGNVNGINIVFKNDVYWTQNGTGTASQYKVSADDMWYSIARGIYSNDKTRQEEVNKDQAGSALDFDAESSRLSNYQWGSPTSSSSISGWIGSFSNTYGLNLSDFKDLNGGSFIDKTDPQNEKAQFKFNRQLVSGSTLKNKKVSNFWKNMFSQNGGTKLIPSAQIKSLVQTPFTANGKTLGTNNPVNKYGVYQFVNLKWNQYCGAGQYYIKESTDKYLVFARNQNYVDKNWLALTDTVDTVTYSFIDKNAFDLAQFNGYKQGLYVTSALDPKTASNTDIAAALSNADEWGLTFTKGFTNNQGVGDYDSLSALPILANESGALANAKYYFSDGYAKALFGSTLSDLAAGNTTWLKHQYTGPGLEFRTALRTAINKFAMVAESTSTSQEWGLKYAPEQAINFQGANPDDPFTPIESDKLKTNSIYKYNSTTQKITDGVNVPRSEYIGVYTTPGLSLIEKSGVTGTTLSTIKDSIKNALDASGVVGAGSVSFEIPIARALLDEEWAQFYERLRVYLNSLDPRIKVVAQYGARTLQGPTNEPTIESYLNQGRLNPQVLSNGNSSNYSTEWQSRLMAANKGSGAFSIQRTIDSFKYDTIAAPIMQNIGYLQEGSIFPVVLAGANGTNAYVGTGLESLSVIYNALKNAWDEVKASWQADGADLLGFTSTEKTNIFNALLNFNLDKIASSNSLTISEYDYLGWEGLETIKAASANADAGVRADSRVASTLINLWFEDAILKLDEELGKLSKSQVEDVLHAFEMVSSFTINPFTERIGNRQSPGFSLKKTWYSTNFSSYKYTFIGTFRVS